MLQSVKTALQVFETLAQEQPIGVSDLARHMGLNKSTVQRCLLTLHDVGWIRPIGDGATKWILTARILSLGSCIADGAHLTHAALPVMQRLRDTTEETIHLAVMDARDSVLLERLESRQPVRIFYPVGSRVPLNASATGKAILSRLPEQQLEAFLARPLDRVTECTIADTDQLRDELRTVRALGWAAAIDEIGHGASAIAAPILTPAGDSAAAISISGPTARFGPEARQKYAKLIVQAAREVSDRMYGVR